MIAPECLGTTYLPKRNVPESAIVHTEKMKMTLVGLIFVLPDSMLKVSVGWTN